MSAFSGVCTSNHVTNIDCTNFLNDRKCSNEIATLDNFDFILMCLFSKICCFIKVALLVEKCLDMMI
jgi:hypothetical protein